MKGWKTIIVNLALVVFGFLETVDFTTALGDGKASYVLMGIGVANMILRSLTTTPVGKAD